MNTALARRRAVILVIVAAALLVVTQVGAQTGAFYLKARLIPFADPSDSAGNNAAIYTHASLAPGETSAWHKHTGDIYMLVSMGTVTEDLGCGSTMDFAAGTVAHTPANVTHRVTNNGNSEALFATFEVWPRTLPSAQPSSEPSCE
jgi:quercetin dioxygenase-like cupin family protein